MNVFLLALGVCIVFAFLIYFLSINTAFYVVVIVVFGALILSKTLMYFYNIDVSAKITKVFSGVEADVNINELPNAASDTGSSKAGSGSGSGSSQFNVMPSSSSTVPAIKLRPQVFNIPGNNYDYMDANALCLAYGARLANYQEIEDAYNRGGEWCNYGWSQDQMALFPTQQASYDKLQKIKGHEHDCGRPGVNGGYIDNPNVKFGVNCYGYKPEITSVEEEMMKNVSPFPKSMDDVMLEKRVQYWKGQLTNILVSPFNHQYWSKLLKF
jgi:hypothetical protein